MNPLLKTDFYKIDHRRQYPVGTNKIYSNFTSRQSRTDMDGIVFFGLKAFVNKYLIEDFNDNFFNQNKETLIAEYKQVMKDTLGIDDFDTKHIEDLHDLGYLPLEIKALPEGDFVPCGVPCLTITNTDPNHAWLVNYIETLMSCELWQSCTSATTSYQYRKLLDMYARLSIDDEDKWFVDYQAHDFSFRGMSSFRSAVLSGMGHLLHFKGTDTIPAILGMKKYYGKDISNGQVGTSVFATEHSVMCAGGKENEEETYRRLITEVYPKGIVSIVSDTWNLWNVLTNILPSLKDEILARDGKVVIRPDSGDPVDIICGTLKSLGKSNTKKLKHVDNLSYAVRELAFKNNDDMTSAVEVFHGGYDVYRTLAFIEDNDRFDDFKVYFKSRFNVAPDYLHYVKDDLKNAITTMLNYLYDNNVSQYGGGFNGKNGYRNGCNYTECFSAEIDEKKIKVKIYAREGDSETHIHVCEEELTSEEKGVIELLWETFGGYINKKGFKVLNPKIGAIYGDSITLERADEICKRLIQKGFSTQNIVFGIGSYTYQYNTRDTYGFAVKSTYCEVNGEPREIFKDPITKGNAVKKSAKGLLTVVQDEFTGPPEFSYKIYRLIDQVSQEEEKQGHLKTVFKGSK